MRKPMLQALIASYLLAPCFSLTVHAAENAPHELGTFVVTANKDKQSHGSLVNETTQVGNVGRISFMNNPGNALSLSEKVIEQNHQPTRAFFDVVTHSPSVQVGGTSTDNNVELQMRGIEYNLYDILVDGLPGLMPMGSNSLNWVDSVEVSIGGNSSLNGLSPYRSATGYINVIPKEAGNKNITTYTQSFSGKSIHTESIDIGRKFGADNEWGIRINGMLSKGETSTERDRIEHNNFFVNLTNENKTHKTSILAGYEKVKHTGMPEVLLLRNNVWGGDVTFLPNPKDVEENFMPNWSILSRTRKVLMITHDQRITDDWRAIAKWGYQSIDYPGYLDGKPQLLNNAGDYTLTINGKSSQSRFLRHSTSLQVKGDVKTKSIKHHITLGYDKFTSMNEWSKGKDGTSVTYKGNIYNNSSINSFNPPVVAPADYYKGSDDRYSSIYVSDYMLLNNDKLGIITGLRRQGIHTMKYDKSAVTPTFAALYHITDHTSIYGTYGDTLDVATAPKDAKNARETLEPYHVKQYEFGVKHDFGKIAASLDYFVVQKPQGVYSEDKTYTMDGKLLHKGVEFNVFGKLADRVNFQGGMMFLHTDLKDMTNKALNGKKAYGTSPFNATLALIWETPKKGLTVNARALYMGSSYADAMNKIKVPGWMRVDLGATYKVDRPNHSYKFQANVYNLFNKKYWSTTVVKWGESGLMLNPGRSFYTSFSFDF